MSDVLVNVLQRKAGNYVFEAYSRDMRIRADTRLDGCCANDDTSD